MSGLVKATGSILYTPVAGYTGADSFTYTASDGLDTSAPGVATVSVRLPPKAPAVRIRTGRTHLLRGERIHVLVECPPIAIGPCRVAVHLFVAGQSKGYGFSRVVRRATGRVVTRADRGEGAHEGAGRGHGARQVSPGDRRQADDPDPAVGAALR